MTASRTPRTVAIETLGCKVNQYESSCLIEVLKREGFSVVAFRERADVYIVHTCAVTARAGFQARQLLRRARRHNPLALVVAAGCYARLDADRIAGEGLATHILGNVEKFDIPAWLRIPGSFADPCRATGGEAGAGGDFDMVPVSRMHTGRTRATLKIQDGCNSFCSYCVVPLVRGRSRSLPLPEALGRIELLMDAGYREIVLSGIHLGQWGKDLVPREDLLGLLRAMEARPHPPRLRLSSLEPMEIDSGLIGFISSRSWVCPHFHVPLQSGDSAILERMRRPYGPSGYEDLVNRIHESLPRAAIGADVMVGFPGESEKQFQNTFDLIEKLPLAYLHVFPFSPRPGTPAEKFPDQVRGGELKLRAGLLRELGRRKKRQFRGTFIGECLEALIQTRLGPGLWEGLSPNYINVIVKSGAELKAGAPASVDITGFRGEDLEGELRGEPMRRCYIS